MKSELDALVNKTLKYIDRRGGVLDKFSTQVNRGLEMELRACDFYFWFKVYSHCQGNGSSHLIVKQKDEVIFEASGKFMSAAYDMALSVDKNQSWAVLVDAK